MRKVLVIGALAALAVALVLLPVGKAVIGMVMGIVMILVRILPIMLVVGGVIAALHILGIIDVSKILKGKDKGDNSDYQQKKMLLMCGVLDDKGLIEKAKSLVGDGRLNEATAERIKTSVAQLERLLEGMSIQYDVLKDLNRRKMEYDAQIEKLTTEIKEAEKAGNYDTALAHCELIDEAQSVSVPLAQQTAEMEAELRRQEAVGKQLYEAIEIAMQRAQGQVQHVQSAVDLADLNERTSETLKRAKATLSAQVSGIQLDPEKLRDESEYRKAAQQTGIKEEHLQKIFLYTREESLN